MIDTKTCEVHTEYSAELQKLYTHKASIEKDIAIEYSREVEQKGLQKNKLKLECSTQYGYYMKMPRTESTALLGKGVVQISAQKSGVLFTTETMKIHNAKMQSIVNEIEAETEKAVYALRNKIHVYKEWLEMINHIAALIDVFCAFAYFAVQNDHVKPVLTDGKYEIGGAYHPLLPAIHRVQIKRGMCVPEITKIDLVLDTAKLCVITGPNMGGKTTFLKTVALVTVMAQMGMYVPAEYARVPVFTALNIRIGASDAPDDNISTFMAEMIDVSKILNEADSSSLVIIDELGRGTSDADGYAIAQATVEHIMTIGAHTLFATHFHDICDTPGIVNSRMYRQWQAANTDIQDRRWT